MNTVSLRDKNLFYIGGVVRDKLLGKDSFDIDLTYSGNAVEFAKNLPDAQILQINEPFGTVKIKFEGEEIDIASTRSETYPQKGHLPVVQNIGCSLKEDILRRDFTINAMAMSTLDGEIIDYVNGLEDIKNKKLRILHKDSFIDDPTRILRGLKFAVRFDFELEEETKKLQEDYLNNINYDMSYKRLKKELVETFNLNSWRAFEIFTNEKMYTLLAPQEFELPKINLEPIISKYNPENIWLIYVGLLEDISSLPLTKQEKNIVESYNYLKNKHFEEDFSIFSELNNAPLEAVIMLATKDYDTVKKYLTELKDIKISITGKDLITLGLVPSPKFQEIFDYVLKEKLKNPELTKAQELELVKIFISNSATQ